MRMYATYEKKLSVKLNEDGGITTQNGVQGPENKKVILCQSHPFPEGCGDEDEDIPMKVVEFNKPLSEIYLDLDDGNEVLEADLLPGAPLTYGKLKEEELKDFCMFGSYVKEIKAHEIVKIHDGKFNYNDGWVAPKEFKEFN